jgi:zinc transporter 5/7
METPEIQTDMLILVSVLGLIVNIFGLCSFHDLSHGDNNNLKGVFLHVLADTLGSVGVIISSVLIKLYDWHISDPISSLIISTLILLSVTELLGTSVTVMMESDDHKKGKKLKKKLKAIPGVEEVDQIYYWKVAGKVNAAMAALKVEEAADRVEVMKQAKELLPEMSTVQIT